MSTAQFTLTLSHTGLLPNGQPNLNDVLVNDLETGGQFQLRKVPVYVPVGGSITFPLSANGLLSYANGVISKFVSSGVLTAQLFMQPPIYTDVTRPAATTFPVGAMIYNTSDNAPNYSDGTAWRDAAGNLT
jgi:hypothetical protein